MESRSAYGYYGAAGGFTGESVAKGNPLRVPYREYKQKWADHKTVAGSYDSKDKTIEVVFEDDEMAKKTNLGNRYEMRTFWFRFGNVERGICPICDFQAKNEANAVKNAKAYARRNGYTFDGSATINDYIKASERRTE